jgi:hypothetical protein
VQFRSGSDEAGEWLADGLHMGTAATSFQPATFTLI